MIHEGEKVRKLWANSRCCLCFRCSPTHQLHQAQRGDEVLTSWPWQRHSPQGNVVSKDLFLPLGIHVMPMSACSACRPRSGQEVLGLWLSVFKNELHFSSPGWDPLAFFPKPSNSWCVLCLWCLLRNSCFKVALSLAEIDSCPGRRNVLTL